VRYRSDGHPQKRTDHTPIHSSNCGGFLGHWGELQDDFYAQARGAEAFDLNKAISRRSSDFVLASYLDFLR
jgi:hypothetical protein